ncbi:MAG: hypothetical protein HWE20_14725 [Gammaproteobacteria bacterium]|nr:hypothetical protein [Gammaproteobacteria bacterium]
MATTANPNWHQATSAVDVIAPPPTDSAASDKFEKLVGNFVLTQGPLAGSRLSSCILPWQQRLVRWVPHVSEVAVKIGKGSGKSVLLSAIALGSVMDWVTSGTYKRGLVVILASNVETARIVFNHLLESIFADDFLKGQFSTNTQQRFVKHTESGIVVQIIPGVLKRAVGLRPNLLCIDELHVASESREFGDVVHQLKSGGANNSNFKTITITTAPVHGGQGVYLDWLAKARAIRDGKIKNDKFLPVLYEFPVLQRPDISPDDSSQWFRGMPSLITEEGGVGTMTAAAMEAELQNALDDADVAGLVAYQNLLSQRLGIEADERQGGGLTLLSEYWDDCKTDALPSLASNPAFIACDPSSGLSDPFAVILMYEVNGVLCVLSRQWLTEEGFSRAPNKLRRIYDQAKEARELIVVPTTSEIESGVFSYINEIISRAGGGVTCGGDAAGLSGFKERFESAVWTYEPISQGWQLHAAFERMCGLAFDNQLLHLGQPLLTANVKNLRLDGNRLKKADAGESGQGQAKIDGAMAMLSGLQLQSSNPILSIEGLVG